jgi:fructose-1,6-bisphosphatase/inositol monophosphatase family enzyme
MNELELIQTFEDKFIEAGQLAKKLRANIKVHDKFHSGIKDIDIVTSADLEVQEFILKTLANSDLKNCEIIAEEDTPSKKLFAKKTDLVITVDPIDGTKAYATGKKYYSVIVTIHDRNRPLYTFDYFPEINWGIKIVNDNIHYIGKKPDTSKMIVPSKTIAYAGFEGKYHPKKSIPKLYEELSSRGYAFKTKSEIGYNTGATMSLLLGIVDGFYYEDGSAVDCLVGLHFGLANGYKIYRTMDITEPKPSDFAGGSSEYKGYYLVLRK